MPVNLAQAQMVASPKKDVLYTIGNEYVPHRNEIYKFSCSGDIETCQWSKVNIELKYGMTWPVAFWIPDDLADKLCK